MVLDGLLEDRQVSFLDKLAAAQGALCTSSSIVARERVLNWTLSALLKLSKVQDPQVDIFSSALLWHFLSFLLNLCFGEAVKYTDISSISIKIRCKQPVLPAFVCYLRLFRECSEEFLCALRCVAELCSKNHMDVGGQVQSYIELCQAAKEHACCYDFCLGILLVSFEKFSSKKTLLPLLAATVSLLSSYHHSNSMTDGVLGIVLDEIGPDGRVEESVLQLVASVSGSLQVRFLELFLLRFKAEPSDKYRQLGFALFKQLLPLRPSNVALLLDLLDKKHVYVRRNDSIYNEQEAFLKALIPDASSVALSGLLSLDYYLIVDEFEAIRDSDVLHAPLFQSTLFDRAVRSREVDAVIRLLRHKQVKPEQGVLFRALMHLDLHMLRHYEAAIRDCHDAYWEVLVYLCQYPDIEERVAACTLSATSKHTLLRYSNCAVREAVELDVRCVPDMTAEQFAQFLASASVPSVMEMLKVAVFYEFGQCQRPFERWLLHQDAPVQSDCLQLLPAEYLSNRTCKKLLAVPGIGRVAKRRVKVLQYAIDHGLLDDPQVLRACCVLAVTKQDHPGSLLKLLPSHLAEVLQVKPANPHHLHHIMSFFEPTAAFIPYAVLCEDKAPLLERIRRNDPDAVVHHPHLYGVPLKQVRADCVVHAIMEYPEEDQRAYLQEAGAVGSSLINRMLSDKHTRASALHHLATVRTVDTSTAKLLTGMVKVDGHQVLPLILGSLAQTSKVHEAIQCMSLLARHRFAAVMSPPFVTPYFELLVGMVPRIQDTLTCHDYNRIIFDVGQRLKTRLEQEAVLCLLLKYVCMELPAAFRTILDRGMCTLLRFVKDPERALLWCPDDFAKSRLRDLLQ